MKRMLKLQAGLAFVMACFLAGLVVRAHAGQAAGNAAVQVKPSEIGGVVTSVNGPEAGVWVIAETKDLPTKFVKIVVTDDQGRYLVPELPKAKYDVWVRGYGLVDSPKVSAMPGKLLDLKAVVAPSAKAAAEYYPADYWYSLIQVPAKSEFPMNPTPAPPFKKLPGFRDGPPAGTAVNLEAVAAPRTMDNQEQWIDVMKQGCEICHQIGDKDTRDLTHLAGFNFKSSEEAWATRTHFSQKGYGMSGTLPRYVDQQRAIKMFADWTDRIAAGELPPVPPRPQGIERNVVISLWDWGVDGNHVHDEISTDKRHPTINANGLIYAADEDNGNLLAVDPVRNIATLTKVPTIQDPTTMKPKDPPSMILPSPFYGESLIWTGVSSPHNPMMDQTGRVWLTSNVRDDNNPDWCKQGSDNKFAQYFPVNNSGKQASIYDPETKKFALLDTCFGTHHLEMGDDADNTMYFSNPGGQVFGWINSKVLDQTGDVKKAQGWCPAYLDTNGTGIIDPKTDKRVGVNGYGIGIDPIDHSIWMATTGPVPGHLLRISLGSNPPQTCVAEVYEPPFNNPKMPGVFAYSPRGIDVDSKGVVWTALSGSSQMASFDRRKCKVTNGPTATGQQCPEGWTLYRSQGPKMKGVEDDVSANFEYYNWVDRHNTLGLGEDIPIMNGTDSDSLEALIPSTKTWVVMRVPYPMGFYSRGLDGRIDDPNGGWKGRGVWADYGSDVSWHYEGGPGTKSKLVKFQIRPNPLAD